MCWPWRIRLWNIGDTWSALQAFSWSFATCCHWRSGHQLSCHAWWPCHLFGGSRTQQSCVLIVLNKLKFHGFSCFNLSHCSTVTQLQRGQKNPHRSEQLQRLGPEPCLQTYPFHSLPPVSWTAWMCSWQFFQVYRRGSDSDWHFAE